MGGKHKQAQRTKNNVRPSSSGRSAELLGTNPSSFVGFSTFKDGGYVPALPSFTEDLDSSIHPNFHLVLKKMNKKDATTKLKALNEFASLCRESEAAAVKAVLPFWPRLYCILATDTEHRVREAAHNAHRAVVSSVGRSIAPHLKQIAGAWFTSQYDTYPPASSAATLSFQEAFPPNKLTEAIIFCQEEILNYIYDNLINQTPQTLSNPKICTAEEIEAKYQRVVVSSLHGYAFYLSKLPEEQLKKAEELNKKLISNSKFWKFAKHEVNIVRVAWFTAIVNLCQKASFFLENEKKHVVTSVFNSLDDSDSVVLPIVWEAALHVVVTVEDWFDFVSIEKLVFPKLWRVLREGGLGSTSSIFPNILPFLSKLPAKLITDKQAFYKRFFSSLQESLKQRNVWISVIESEAVAECYVECFGYVVMLHTEELEFCQSLISDQLLSVIEVTLKDSRLHLFRQAFYNKLVNVLVQWSKHKLQESYSQLLNDVIKKFEPLFDKLIEDSKLDKQQMQIVLKAQADLLSAFKCQQLQKHNKRLKVTFAEEKDGNTTETVTTSAQKTTNYFEETPVQFKSLVYDLVKNLIEKYFNYISSIGTCKHLFISQLAKIVTVFESNDVFIHLTSLSGDEKSWNEFYSNFITVWLKDEDILIDDVYQLIFTLLKYVPNEDEKQFILHSLDQTETKKVLEWCLKNENNSRRSVRQWLLSDKMDSIIISIIDEAIAINSTNNNAESIVKSCLRMKDEDGNILIKYETVILIMNYLLETLMKFENIKDEVDVDILSGLISACLSVFKGHFEEQYNESVINVVLECFKFCLSTDTVCTKLDRTWQDSVTNLAFSNNSELITCLNGKCSKAVKRFINERICLSLKELLHIVRQCVKYLISLQKSESVNSEKFIELFIKEVLNENNNNNEVLNLCYAGEVINSNLSLPSFHIIPENVLKCNLRESFADNIVTKFVTSSLFSVVLLLEMLGIDRNNYMDQDIVCSEDSEDDDDASSEHVLNIDLGDYTTYLSDSILKVAGARVLKNCYSKSKQYFGVRDKINILEKCTKELIQRLGIDGSKDVERELILRGSDSIIGGMCAEGVFILHNDFIGTDNHKNILETIISENQLTVSQSDMLSLWVPQVFSVGVEVESLCSTKSSLSELAMLCSYLKKQDFKEDSPSLNLYSDWLDKIIKFGKLPTFEVDLSTCSSSDVQLSANAAELLSLVLKKRNEDIAKYSGWDFTMIATASWVATIKKTTSMGLENYCSLEVLQFFCSVLHLFKSLSDYIASCVNFTDAQKVTEWNDVFVADVHRTLIDVWVNIAGNCQSVKNIQPELLIVLNELSNVVDKYIETKLFIDNTNIDHWLEVSCRYLQSSVADIQFTAYTLLMKLTPHLVVSNSETEEECRVKVTMKQIEDTLKSIQTIVDAMLDDFKLGDTCIVEPFTDGYVYARGYLFLWLAILDLCDKADPQLRFAYTSWIKESCFLGYLMKTLFCLMPEQAVHGHEGNVKHVQELFSNPPEISTGFCESKALAHLSCWTYYKLLGRLPAEVRQWWSEIDHKVGIIVERLTSTFVSPLLCANEMKAVRLEGKNIQNMTVHVHTASREVIAVYVVEESSTELVIQLPINHPLGPTKVESGKCMVSTNQTRQWIMQLSLFLTHQNGSIWDALSLWKNLIDKKFEGVEECYICFAILHNVTQQLPKLTCQTCKKKFHNTCLYRWFTTSNKSTCPICRNLF